MGTRHGREAVSGATAFVEDATDEDAARALLVRGGVAVLGAHVDAGEGGGRKRAAGFRRVEPGRRRGRRRRRRGRRGLVEDSAKGRRGRGWRGLHHFRRVPKLAVDKHEGWRALEDALNRPARQWIRGTPLLKKKQRDAKLWGCRPHSFGIKCANVLGRGEDAPACRWPSFPTGRGSGWRRLRSCRLLPRRNRKDRLLSKASALQFGRRAHPRREARRTRRSSACSSRSPPRSGRQGRAPRAPPLR